MNEIRKYSTGALMQGRQLWRILFFVYLVIGLLFVGVGVLEQGSGWCVPGILFAGYCGNRGSSFFCRFCLPARWHALVCFHDGLFVFPAYFAPAERRFGSFQTLLLQAGILTGALLMMIFFFLMKKSLPLYLHVGEKFGDGCILIVGRRLCVLEPE